MVRTRYDSVHDRFTGLPNRRFLCDYVGEALSSEASSTLALLVVNIDDFPVINDTFGYEYGARVLDRIGHVIRSILPEVALLARIPGDFGIVLPLTSGSSASEVAAAVVRELEAPLQVEDITVELTASIGIAAAPEDGTDAEVLLRHATSARRLQAATIEDIDAHASTALDVVHQEYPGTAQRTSGASRSRFRASIGKTCRTKNSHLS